MDASCEIRSVWRRSSLMRDEGITLVGSSAPKGRIGRIVQGWMLNVGRGQQRPPYRGSNGLLSKLSVCPASTRPVSLALVRFSASQHGKRRAPKRNRAGEKMRGGATQSFDGRREGVRTQRPAGPCPSATHSHVTALGARACLQAIAPLRRAAPVTCVSGSASATWHRETVPSAFR